MPPPPRRRPVPTTPTTRPRVAGLRKRSGATPAEIAGLETDPEFTPVDDTTDDTTDETTAEPAGTTTEPTDTRAAAGSVAEPATELAAEPATEPAAEPAAEADLPDPDEPLTEADRREKLRAEAERAERRQVEAAGLIEPGLGEPGPDEVEAEAGAEAEADEVEDGEVAPAPSARPTGRRKRTGEPAPVSVFTDIKRKHSRPDTAHAAGRTDTDRTAAHAADRTGRHGLVLPIALLVLAGLLVGLGLWFRHQAGGVHYNQALVDSAGTTEVAGQTREAVEKAFSYNFADVGATEKAANDLLVGKAQCQYNAIFDPVRKLAPEQKLVVTVKAVSTGVTSLDGDRATVLLFLDQVALRTTDNQSSGGIAMMRVGARKVDGRWKVDNMEMFGQAGDQAVETAKC